MVIENSMNMTQFTNSFLKREFSERYGYYDEHHGKYIITGKNIVVECSYDEKIESFEVMRIFEVATDRTCALTHNMEYVYCSDDYDESFL